MKLKISVCVLCLLSVLMLGGCTHSENTKIDSVHYFVLDSEKQSGGVVLYALMKYDEAEKEEREDSLVTVNFEGENAESAFLAFFKECKGVYTGTVKEYAVAEGLGKTALEEMKIYITNSPVLPAKRETIVVRDVNSYIANKTGQRK